MARITIDILDKELTRTTNYYSSLNKEVRFRFLREEFLLDRYYWEKYHKLLSKVKFTWNEFKYTDITSTGMLDTIIPTDDIGVYVFIIKGDNLILDAPKFIFYVGIAGERNSGRPLRTRLKDYFYTSVKKRKQVHRLLSMYHKNVYVSYSTMKVSSARLSNIEKCLHGFFYPVCNERDFPVEIKDLRKAFGGR